MNSVERPIETLLFEGHVQAIVASTFQNERPPSGLAGVLDWYFQGKISHGFRAGIITGKEDECVYFPVSNRTGPPYHLFLVGGGFAAGGSRAPFSPGSLKILQKNLNSLKIESVGVSRSDLGSFIEGKFKIQGVSLWIGP